MIFDGASVPTGRDTDFLSRSIPMIAYLFWRYDRPRGTAAFGRPFQAGSGDDACAEDMADLCQQLHEELGVKAMKLKGGVMDPMEEARALELCRDRLGDDFGLRIDPNGTWSVATAVRVGQRIEALHPEYFEDPAWGLEGNAAVRKAVRIPIATNMYPNKFDDLGPAAETMRRWYGRTDRAEAPPTTRSTP